MIIYTPHRSMVACTGDGFILGTFLFNDNGWKILCGKAAGLGAIPLSGICVVYKFVDVHIQILSQTYPKHDSFYISQIISLGNRWQ